MNNVIGTHALVLYDRWEIMRYAHQRGWMDWDCNCMAANDSRMRHSETCSVTPIYASIYQELGWPDFGLLLLLGMPFYPQWFMQEGTAAL
jgi:hypothetical protein